MAQNTRSISCCRGFITLSASLGLMALALHEGLLEALKRESSSAVLAQDLKALAALVAATPYHRLPSGLLTRTLQASELGTVNKISRLREGNKVQI